MSRKEQVSIEFFIKQLLLLLFQYLSAKIAAMSFDPEKLAAAIEAKRARLPEPIEVEMEPEKNATVFTFGWWVYAMRTLHGNYAAIGKPDEKILDRQSLTQSDVYTGMQTIGYSISPGMFSEIENGQNNPRSGDGFIDYMSAFLEIPDDLKRLGKTLYQFSLGSLSDGSKSDIGRTFLKPEFFQLERQVQETLMRIPAHTRRGRPSSR